MEVAKALDEHLSRRMRGIPTVSVLTGSVSVALRASLSWAEIQHRRLIRIRPQSSSSLKHEAWRHLSEHSELSGLALERGARLVGLSESRLGAVLEGGGRERSVLLGQIRELEPSDSCLAELLEGRSLDLEVHLEAVLELLGPERLPIVTWPEAADSAPETVEAFAASMVSLAERAPSLPIHLPLGPESWRILSTTGAETRWRAVLRHGLIEVPNRPCSNVKSASRWSDEVESSRSEANQALHEASSDAAQSAAVDRAKSAAEAFLFRVLEECPWSTGRFLLNQQWRDEQSGKSFEIDLMAKEAKLAVEIDGHYHFLGPEGYRRDRRKDRALQRNGLVILRFLAEDVVSDLEQIVDTIKEFIRFRDETGR